jgi:hypothetical protein
MTCHYGVEYRIPLPSTVSVNQISTLFPELNYDRDRRMIILVNHQESKKMFFNREYSLENYYKYNSLVNEWNVKNVCVPFYNNKLVLSPRHKSILYDISDALGMQIFECGQWYEYFENTNNIIHSRCNIYSVPVSTENHEDDQKLLNKLENPFVQFQNALWVISRYPRNLGFLGLIFNLFSKKPKTETDVDTHPSYTLDSIV